MQTHKTNEFIEKNAFAEMSNHFATFGGCLQMAAGTRYLLSNCISKTPQQGKGTDASLLMTNLKSLTHQAQKASRVEALRGIEGTAAKGWFEFFRSLLPPEWSFPSRISHPPIDPINALLSLGYTLALSRCQQAFRLKPSQFKDFIGGFEKQFLAVNGSEPSFRDQTQTRIDGIAASLREPRHSVLR